MSHWNKTPSGKPRLRGLGIHLVGTPGPFNAITDVAGVEVGQQATVLPGAAPDHPVTGQVEYVGAVVDPEQSCITQPLHDRRKKVVVGALAHDVVVGQENAELAVHLVEVLGAERHERAPEAECLGITALQFHHPVACTRLELLR